MTALLHLDWESRGVVDLRVTGLHRYARDADTDLWCGAYAFGDEEPEVWTPDQPCPPRIVDHVRAGGHVLAWNAPFEAELWRCIATPRYGWPELDARNLFCVMARAYAMNLPGGLEDAALVMGLSFQKDAEGRSLMLRMSRPRSKPGVRPLVWWSEPEKVARLCSYSKQDVRVERALHKRLVPLSATERRVWLMDHAINTRGVAVDVVTAEAAIDLAAVVKTAADERLAEITHDKVEKHTALIPLKDWLASRGVPVDSLDKAAVTALLERTDLPADVRQALKIRQETGKASVAKLGTMIEIVGDDGRVHHTIQYHGAGTGRFAGRKIQPHNYIRDVPPAEDVELAFKLVREKNYRMLAALYGPPMSMLSRCMRGFFVAPKGKLLVVGDFSAVEGRGTAWISGEEWKLDLFRQCDANPDGPDVYMHTAGGILHKAPKDVTKGERQAYGKVPELALGYQGGVGAFQTMAKTYGVQVSDMDAENIKLAWRALHPATVRTWYALQRAAIAAVERPGEAFTAGHPGRGVTFKVVGSFLWCKLPSGRCTCYPYPKVLEGAFGPQLTYMTVPNADDVKKSRIIEDPQSTPGKWVRIATYGGSLMENVVQAICRDLLVECMLEMHDAGAKIVLHVHDEIVIEVDEAKAQGARAVMHRIMNSPPEWAGSFPLICKPEAMRRYGK